MKHCPKCNRTFPDENQKFCTVDGGLLITQPAFDPNVTMRATSTDLPMPGTPTSREMPTSRELPDTTLFDPGSARTAVLSRDTGPTRMPTVVDAPAPPPPPPAPVSAPLPAAAAPQKKSKLPLILGLLAVVLILGIGGVVAVFFLVIQPRLEEMDGRRVATEPTPATPTQDSTPANANTAVAETSPVNPPFAPPDGAVKFANSSAQLEGKLAEHYFDFSFYYPEGWKVDPRAGVAGASNFAKVERMLPPDFTQENFAVGWYTSKGTFEADKDSFPQLVELLSESLSRNFPEYRKVSEGPTKINSMDGYEFRFESLSKGTEKGDIQLWGRVVFLPAGVASQNTGATLIMLSTSLAPELSGVSDVGEKGQLPLVLESFRFGKS